MFGNFADKLGEKTDASKTLNSCNSPFSLGRLIKDFALFALSFLKGVPIN